jgi:hypothetical protein
VAAQAAAKVTGPERAQEPPEAERLAAAQAQRPGAAQQFPEAEGLEAGQGGEMEARTEEAAGPLRSSASLGASARGRRSP